MGEESRKPPVTPVGGIGEDRPRDPALGGIEGQPLWTSRSSATVRNPAGRLSRGYRALDDELEAVVCGRDLASGLPTSITRGEVRAALEAPLEAIMAAVRETLERTPPEFAADVMRDGITLFGGGSLPRGFAQRLGEETQLATRLADSPLTCVAEGAGRSLGEFETLERSGRSARAGAR